MVSRQSTAGVGLGRVILNLLVLCSLLSSSVSLAATAPTPTPRTAAGPPAARQSEFGPWPAVAAGNPLAPTATASLTPTATLTPTLTATATPTATLTLTPTPTPQPSHRHRPSHPPPRQP